MGIGFWPLFEPEQSTFNTSVLFYLFFMLIYLCFLIDIFCIFYSCSLDGKISVCVSRCFSCRRPDSFSPRWPDHSGRDPPAVDTRQLGVPQRADLWHRHEQHQQHHTPGYTHPPRNSVIIHSSSCYITLSWIRLWAKTRSLWLKDLLKMSWCSGILFSLRCSWIIQRESLGMSYHHFIHLFFESWINSEIYSLSSTLTKQLCSCLW